MKLYFTNFANGRLSPLNHETLEEALAFCDEGGKLLEIAIDLSMFRELTPEEKVLSQKLRKKYGWKN